MPQLTLRELYRNMARRIYSQGPDVAAAVCAACAERFLLLYDSFAALESWGDPEAVETHLEAVWRALHGEASLDLEVVTEELVALAPHGDDFASIETTFAQDVCSLVILAACAKAGQTDSWGLAPALEILRVAMCVEETGFLNLGSGPGEVSFDKRFVQSELLVSELRHIEEDLGTLIYSGAQPSTYETIRRRAQSRRYSTGLLLPTQAGLKAG